MLLTIMTMVCPLLKIFQVNTVIFPDLQELEQFGTINVDCNTFIGFNIGTLSNNSERALVVVTSNYEEYFGLQDQFETHHWLIPLSGKAHIEEHFIPVPLNSNVYIYTQNWTVSEIYHIKCGTLKKNDLFQWNQTSQTFSMLTKTSYLERRANMSGTHIHAITKPWSNLCDVVPNGNNSDGSQFIGVFHTLIKAMAYLGKFTYTITDLSHEEFGNLLPNGTFSGLAGRIQRAEADIGTYGFTMTESRASLFEIFPVYNLKSKIVMKNPPLEPSLEFLAFLTVFTKETWIGIMILIGVSVLIAQLIAKSSTTVSGQVNFLDSISTPVLSHKLFWFTIWFCGPFFFAAYSSMLVSDFTGRPKVLKINTYKDVFELGYDITLWKDGTESELNFAGKTEPHLVALFNNARPHESYEEALKFIEEDSKLIAIANEEGFFDKDVHIEDFQEGLDLQLGYVLPLGSEFIDVFRYLYIKTVELGIKDFEIKFCNDKRTKVKKYDEMSGVLIGLTLLIVPISVLFLGVFLSVLVALCEYFEQNNNTFLRESETLKSINRNDSKHLIFSR